MGFVDIIVLTSAPDTLPLPEGLPVKSLFDNEIELLPAKALPLYEREMSELRAMGFDDEHAARHALRACNGDVQNAVERLLGGDAGK